MAPKTFDPKSFPAWLQKLNKKNLPIPERLICLDPGETTGFAYFVDGELVSWKQLATHNIYAGIDILTEEFDTLKPTMVVYEDYRVYAHKAETHSWNTLHTPRLIGGIQTLCHQRGIPRFCQMAQQPKMFCTDVKLRHWGYYKQGQKHSRDAIRHGTYYLLFNLTKIHDEHNLNL